MNTTTTHKIHCDDDAVLEVEQQDSFITIKRINADGTEVHCEPAEVLSGSFIISSARFATDTKGLRGIRHCQSSSEQLEK